MEAKPEETAQTEPSTEVPEEKPVDDGKITFAPAVQKESPQHWGFTLMGGPYRPTNYKGSGDSFKNIYTGDDKETWPLKKEGLWTDVALEWQFFKKFGKLGLKLSSGTWIIRGKHDSSRDTSSAKLFYTLVAVPVFLGGIYHLHFWDSFPIVPFVEVAYGGFRFQQIEGASKDKYAAIRRAYLYGGGVQFNLNFIDRKAGRDFDIDWGVNRTFLVAQVRRVQSETSDQFDFSGQNLITGGLLFEF